VRRQFGAQIARTIDSGVYLADRLQDVPVHVIPCVRRSPSASDLFEVATMFGSLLPAVWSFQLALRARGLGTVLTTMHLPHEHEAAALLDIPDRVIQVGLIPVAYYTGRDFRPAVRRPAEKITYWDTWEATRNVAASEQTHG
jgi:nitroreductase